jgi:hypothetical protein
LWRVARHGVERAMYEGRHVGVIFMLRHADREQRGDAGDVDGVMRHLGRLNVAGYRNQPMMGTDTIGLLGDLSGYGEAT